MANGHEAVKMPSGDYLCPLSGDSAAKASAPPAAVAMASSTPGHFTMTIPEALALRAVLSRSGQTPELLHPDTAPEFRALVTRLWDVKPVTPAGNCTCERPTRGMSSFHCGTCGRVKVYRPGGGR
jgi:hypothetical protein